MLQIKCDRVDIGIPELVSDDLLTLRRFLDNETPTVSGIHTPLLEMYCKYESPGIARAVLRAIPPPRLPPQRSLRRHDEEDDVFELRLARMSYINWAARLDCRDAAIGLYASFKVDAYVKHNMPVKKASMGRRRKISRPLGS
jgi:hypothetical protein